MKIVKWVLGILVVLIVVVVVVATLSLNTIVKTAVVKGGPAVLGVPVTLGDVDIALLSGRISLKGLVIGNPPGFKSDHAFKMDRLLVRIQPRSLLSDRITIPEIRIEGPDVIYEISGSGSNLGKISEKAGGAEPASEKESPAAKPEKPAKKVVINDLIVQDGKISVSMTGLGGEGLVVPLPTIHLKDIGKESGGASPKEVVARVVKGIADAAGQAVTGSGQLLGKGIKVTGESAGKVGAAVGEEATKIADGIKGLFGKKPKE
jgi:uncharacterized protein involved in outer membrane biogenesis